MKKVIWFIVVVVIVVIGWYLYKTFVPASVKTPTTAAAATKTNTATKTTTTGLSTSQSYPIRYGDKSTIVQKMQHGLNMNYGVYLVEDGIYGNNTQQALLSSGFSSDVSYDDYLKIINSTYAAQAIQNLFNIF
jgi:hypothetical protein